MDGCIEFKDYENYRNEGINHNDNYFSFFLENY